MSDESLFNVPPTDAPLTAAQIVEQLRVVIPHVVSIHIELHRTEPNADDVLSMVRTLGFRATRAAVTELLGGE